MKKIIILLSVAIAALAVSCNKVTPQDSTPDAPKGEKITISVSLSDALSKVSLTQDPADPDGAIKVAWEATDKIFVIDASNPNNFEAFSIVAGSIDTEKPYTATFEGTAPDASSFNILYGATSVSAANSFNSEQTQTGNASTDHLQYKALVSGVSSIENIEFSKTWAETNGGSFSQNGALRLRIQVPAEVTSVASVSLKAPSTIFSGSETITVKFNASVEPVNGIITAYAMLPMGEAIEVAEGDFVLTIETAEEIEYNKTFSPGSISFKPGQTNAIKLNKSGFNKNNPFAGGSGIEGDPYLIATAEHMLKMDANMTRGEITYFKLIDNIDMDGIEWVSLNNVAKDGHFDKYINFDGDNKTISNLTPDTSKPYPSLFGVMNGTVQNLTIDNATIGGSDKKSGAFAGYIGSSDSSFTPFVSNVKVINSNVGSSSSRITNFCGGFAGQIQKSGTTLKDVSVEDTEVYGDSGSNKQAGGLIGEIKSGATLEHCHSTAKVDARAYIGGLIGETEAPSDETIIVSKCYYSGPSVSASYRYAGGVVGHKNGEGTLQITNCYVTGNISADSGWAGGISGNHYKGTTTIENCYVTGSVTASFGAGGIVGQVNAVGLSVIRAMAFNSSIKATATDTGQHYSSGAVIAYGKDYTMIVSYCYRRANLANDFVECPGNSDNTISQMGFLNSPGILPQGAHQYIRCHHGRNTNMSLCELVHSGAIGEDWSSDIWDWSGATPTIK